MISTQNNEDQSKLKCIWIPHGGPIVTLFDKNNLSQPQDKNRLDQSYLKKLPVIHLDWMVDNEEELFLSDLTQEKFDFIGVDADLYNWALSYIPFYQHRLKEKYPFDKWGVFSNRVKSVGMEELEIEKIFSSEDFGINFISHAHVDHSPLNNSAWNFGDSGEESEKETVAYCVFPVLYTTFTEKLLNLRFKLKANREIMQQYENSINPPNIPKSSRKIFVEIGNYLDQFQKQYFASSGLKKKMDSMCQDYFRPILYKNMIIWLIPNGHVMGSAGLCANKIVDRSKDIQTTMVQSNNLDLTNPNPFESLQLNAEFIYLGEFCPVIRPQCLPCPPIHCNIAMIDGLFADPLLEIPDQEEEIDRLKVWIKEEIQDHPLILICQDLGKPQLIASLVYELNNTTSNEEIVLVLAADTKRLMDLCIEHGLSTSQILSRQEARTAKYPQQKNYILIATPTERDTSAVQNLIEKRGAKTAEITGWCFDPEYRANHPADMYFSISDHVTYPHLLQYLHQSSIQTLMLVNTQTTRVEVALKSEGYQIITENKIIENLKGIF